MTQLINHNSFVFLAVVLLAGLAVYLRRGGFSAQDGAVLALAAAALAAVWWWTRPGPSTFTEVQQVEAQLGQGRPALVEIYSNY